MTGDEQRPDQSTGSVKQTCRKRCWQIFLCLCFVVMICIAGWLLWYYGFGRGGNGSSSPGVTPDQCALRNGTVFNSFCYVSPSLQMSWSDAESYCQGLSGHLASIWSQAENDFVYAQIFTGAHSSFNLSGWFGAHSVSSSIQFSDNSDISKFSYWNLGQPNTDSSYNCAAQTLAPAGKWSMYLCSDIKYFCCKFPLASVPFKPQGIFASPKGRAALVQFYPPTSNGGAAVTNYVLMSSPDNVNATFAAPSTSGLVSLTLNGLSEKKTYTISVAAVNIIGQGPYSAPSNLVTPFPVAPSAPTNLAAQAGSDAVAVTFSAPADNGGSAVNFYIVSVSCTGCTAAPYNGTVSPAIFFTTNGIPAAATMSFTVQAYNSYGASPVATLPGVTLNAGAPAYIRTTNATAGNGQVTVSWTTVSGALNYTIFSDVGSIVTTQLANGAITTGDPQTFTVTGLSITQCYRFSVYANNAAGSGAPSPFSSAACPFAIAPNAPINVTGQSFGLAALVSFLPPSYNGLSPIINYTVEAYFSSNHTLITSTSGPSSPVYIYPLPQTTVYFIAYAVNKIGSSAGSDASADVNIVPGPPHPPTGVTATASAQSATVTWVAPQNNGGQPITSYSIVANPTAPGFPFVVSSPSVLSASVPSPLSQYFLDVTLNYTFSVFANNSLGAGIASVASNIVHPYAQVPFPPTITGVTAGRKSLTVSFNAPVNNGGSPLLQYFLLCSPNCTAVVVNAPATSVTASPLNPRVAYTFTLSVVSAIGVSNSTAATTALNPLASVPSSPLLVVAASGDGFVTVTFVAPLDDGGTPVVNYTVTLSPGGYSTTGAGSPLTVVNVPNGNSYFATVVATNAVGSSDKSLASNSVTPSGSNINEKAIIGGVIGGAILLILVAICICYSQDWLCFKPKNKGNVVFQEQTQGSSMNLTAGTMSTDNAPSTFAVLGGVVETQSTQV